MPASEMSPGAAARTSGVSPPAAAGSLTRERWLGYFLAPALVASTNAICAGYINVFYTDVLNMSVIAGGLFLSLMPMISKIVDAVTNIIMGQFIDRTTSRQGKARPWLLISGPVLAVSAILLFLVPENNITLQVIWVTVSYNLYYSVSYTVYNISNTLMTPLATRNSKQRDTLAMAYSMGFNMVPGMLCSILFPIILLPYMGVDRSRWIQVMFFMALLSIPAAIVQYYFSRERITEETTAAEGKKNAEVSLGAQLRGCLRSRYWRIIIGVALVYWLYQNFQVTSTTYYCNWVLGSYNDGRTIPIVNAIGQAPLGLGVVLLWPLVKKFGKRNIMIAGGFLAVAGGFLCTLNPRSISMVLLGLVLRSFGMLPVVYILLAMLADTLDHVEYINGFRCDGFSASVYSIITTVSYGVSLGVFNLFLGKLGYAAPALGAALPVQNEAIQNFFIAGFFVVPVAAAVIIMVLLLFYDLEKKLPEMQQAITHRK